MHGLLQKLKSITVGQYLSVKIMLTFLLFIFQFEGFLGFFILLMFQFTSTDQSKETVVNTEDTGQQDEGSQQESDEVDITQHTVEISSHIESQKLTEQQRKQIEEEKEVERALDAIEEDELTLQPDTGNIYH